MKYFDIFVRIFKIDSISMIHEEKHIYVGVFMHLNMIEYEINNFHFRFVYTLCENIPKKSK